MDSRGPYIRVVIMVVCVLLIAACGQPYQLRGGVINDPKPAPEIALTNQHGERFTLTSQRGKAVLLFFGFTNCPDICPTTLADLASVREQLGVDAEQVQIVMVSVDPERDTPEQLKSYMAKFDKDAIGLTGTPEQLASIYMRYGVSAMQDDQHGSEHDASHEVEVSHSGYSYVIDPAGNWREVFDFGSPVADIVSDVRHLLQTS